MLTVRRIDERGAWNDALRALPRAHILQSWEWGDFKQVTTGWRPERLAFYHGDTLAGMASVGVRSVAGVRLMYAPKGPVFATADPAHWGAVIAHLEGIARRQRALWLKIDPDMVVATGVPGAPDDTPDPAGVALAGLLTGRGWRFSADQVQFRNTLTLDLTRSEDELMAQFSQNTRRKIRTAEKKGVQVRPATPADLPTLYALYRVTGKRDGFLTRPAGYYERAWRDFMQAGLAHALLAEYQGVAIAHVILFHFGRKCWYFYGASANDHRETMPNYRLQWEAIRWAKAAGYAVYDLWGAPDDFSEGDPLWGVYQFKQGFRGTVTRHIGAWDYAPCPLAYRAYTELLPRVRRALRRGR